MAKKRKPKRKIGMGTAWFLAILVIAALGSYIAVQATILYLVLGICGAIVAILNIKKREEPAFLISATALVVIVMAWSSILDFTTLPALGIFLYGLVVGFGVAGFVVALGLIAKLGID